MQIINSPQYSGLPMDSYMTPPMMPSQNPYGYSQQAPQMMGQMIQQPKVDPRMFETPEITMGESHKPLFSVASDGNTKSNSITVDNRSDAEVKAAKRKKEKKLDLPTATPTSGIIRADGAEQLSGTVEDPSTIYSYGETTNLLHETLGQIDAVNAELVMEFNAIKHNRTMKNKYNVMIGLSENIGSMISNRLNTIKELNNCISKANEMDYKKMKDIKAATAAIDDDKYIADLYQAFIQNPANIPIQMQMPPVEPSIINSGIVRATISDPTPGGQIMDAGYLNYVSNLTPEQNMMRFEGNPDIKQVVVYDASNGRKFFQMMNLRTGEVINNVPVYDQMFMEDTTLDLKQKIAKNINLNESFPIVVINDNITSQY